MGLTHAEIFKIRSEQFRKYHHYQMLYYKNLNTKKLKRITYRKRSGRGDNKTYNEIIIMADTETSKKDKNHVYNNHVVAWTISLRAYGINLYTLYGTRPSEMIDCIKLIHESMPGEVTYVFFHHLAYDYVFLRKFLYKEFGFPVKQLNTKSLYPVNIEFGNGLILRDSLILAQRSLDKWAKDLNVEHQKAKGKWNYTKIRNQGDPDNFSAEELEYIEHDTLAGVECIDATMQALNKSIYSLPYTATGITREDIFNLASVNNGRQLFNRIHMDFDLYIMAEKVYHGGFTHANRHLIGCVIDGQLGDSLSKVKCKDFSSSYPFIILSEKMPMGPWSRLSNKSVQYILDNRSDYAFMFKFVAVDIKLKDDLLPMPALQFSKCVKLVNSITDNGRVLEAAYVEIYLTGEDLVVINDLYTFKGICIEVAASKKEYLPRWLTDYVFERYESKTRLKGGDPVLYSIEKSKINSIYGMFCQKNIRETIIEDYATGEYNVDENYDPVATYEKYLNNNKSVLLYTWGIWVTAYAFLNLFTLGKCVDYVHGGQWIYTDTDSIYSNLWDEAKVSKYNESCKAKLRNNGYGPVLHNNREYWLGIAEDDGTYSQYVALGSKRYCGRSEADGELHITVAGVPKSGAKCLQDDITNFKRGMIFPGIETGKLTHTHLFVDDIYIDENGNETGDSIDLSPCDYLLDEAHIVNDITELMTEEVEIQIYE